MLESVRRLLPTAALLAGVLGVSHACSGGDRAKPFAQIGHDAGSTGGGGGLDASLSDGPPAADAPGLCGNLVIPVITERPNVYFVVDRSGSMSEPLPKSPYNKYVNARIAIGKLLRAIGHRLRYGAAVFPMPAGTQQGCHAGEEIFPTQDGDPASYAAAGKSGPVLTKLLTVLGAYDPTEARRPPPRWSS